MWWNGLWSKKSSFPFKVRWMSCGEVLKKLYERRKEVELFVIDKKSDPSHYLQDKKWVPRLAYLSDIFSYTNELNLKLQGQTQQYLMFGTRSNLSKRNSDSGLIWLPKETMKYFSCTHIIMEADDFYSKNSVSGNFQVGNHRCVDRTTRIDKCSQTQPLIFVLLRCVFTQLVFTKTCFGRYIGHHQVVRSLILK